MDDQDRIEQLEAKLGQLQKKDTAERDSADKRRLVMVVQAAQKGVDDAEAALAEAFDEGDGTEIAKAQRNVAEAIAKREKVTAEAQGIASSRGWSRGNNSGGEELDTSNLEQWKGRHSSWYGIDKDMTKAAHEIDAQIRTAGVIEPGSVEYFDAIDRQMAQKYPSEFRGTPPSGGSGSGPTYTGRGQQRIEATLADSYRKMGIDIDDPAVAKRMIKNRETAVQKGLLPESKPRDLRIRSR